MKKKLYEIFDGATPKELDGLYKEIKAEKLESELLASVKKKVYSQTKLAYSDNEKGRIITMKREINLKRIQKILLASAACIAMMLGCFAGYSALFNEPVTAPVTDTATNPITNPFISTTVTLDVNPSVEIKADEEEKVIDVVALNKDATVIIGDMNFEGNSLDVTVNALVGSMLKNGYINENTNSILLSVDSKNEKIGNVIKDKLSEGITGLINTEEIKGNVISQIVSSADEELLALANEYGITLGKAKLIRTIMRINPEKEFSEYAEMNITELNKAMNDNADKPQDDKTYIGEEKALEIALKEAGLTMNDLSEEPSIEIVASRGDICYFVRFTVEKKTEGEYSLRTYGIYVNAFTGTGHGENVTDPNFTIEEAWEFVCDQIGVEAKKAKILGQRFNGIETALPMTYSFWLEIEHNEYSALVDAMNGVVIRIEQV